MGFKKMLSEVEINDLEEDLLDINDMLEITPLNETETLKDLSTKKEIILRKLGRWKPLRD